jgi:hypothetical protein
MPRPPLPIESWGRISTSIDTTDDNGKPLGFRAKARFRDHDGDGSRRLAPFEVPFEVAVADAGARAAPPTKSTAMLFTTRARRFICCPSDG